jgi:hypothetical protein
MRWARSAANPQRTATMGRATRTRLGRSQIQFAQVTPQAKSHATWNRGTESRPALRPAEAGVLGTLPGVVDWTCIAHEG